MRKIHQRFDLHGIRRDGSCILCLPAIWSARWRVPFEILLIQFEPCVGEWLRFADLGVDFSSELFGQAAGIGGCDSQIPFTIGIQRVDGEIGAADVCGVERFVIIRMVKDITLWMIWEIGGVFGLVGLTGLPDPYLDACFLL